MSKQTNFLPLLLLHLLKLLLLTSKAADNPPPTITNYPFTCTPTSPKSCTSLLYHPSSSTTNLNIDDIASLYSSSNKSLIKPFITGDKNGYLVPVNCSCEALVNGTTTTSAYLHRTIVTTNNASMVDVAYNGQVYNASDGVVSLFCGCLDSGVTVVTYTVEASDSLYGIASTFSSDVGEIEKCNERRNLIAHPNYIDVGWVIFVPLPKVHGPPANDKVHPKQANPKTSVIIGASISTSFFAAGVIFMFFIRRRKSRHINENPKSVTKNKSNKNLTSMQNQFLHLQNMEDGTHFGSERPLIYSLEDVEEATANFDETRKIGQGGYGSVYFGMLGKQEVAIKKMKSNKSKEFFAEVTVLCKVHHINVVELIGYATGDDHLYLVYEYVQNGSLSDHLHDPLLKGHQPLSWSARAQIALDAARGIEYIHDHTKSQYVHRDIKTSNILLDEILRAKVADFGLAKLVERTGEGDCIATRLVGTPGYLPPESVRELQMTTKSDVFAFGVVLAELITGLRALIRDNREAVNMKSLVSIIYATFCEENPQSALEGIIDGNLKGSYPVEEVFKVAELSAWCLNEDAVNRPEMHEIVMKLSQIVTASIEWEASLGGDSQVFSGLFNGR